MTYGQFMNSVLSLVYFKTGFILDLQPGSHFRWVYELGLRFATRVTFFFGFTNSVLQINMVLKNKLGMG